MTMPYYVAPEQVMKDRAEYAQKGIARGRSLVAAMYGSGVLMVAENPSRTLHKISEIYDRVAFAGAGRYNEFDQLRVAGVRHADTKGFAYSREDVDARSLANLYAQFLGQVFTHEMKPLEVEILVAELDPLGDDHQLYHLAYDGTVVDEEDFTVLGGDSDTIIERLTSSYRRGWPLEEALRTCVAVLAGPDRTLAPSDLEAAVLEKGSTRRTFRRLTNEDLAEMLAAPAAAGDAGVADDAGGEPPGGEAEASVDSGNGGEDTGEAAANGGEPEPPAVPGADGT
ncbi:MAG TPA: proteasome subunit alpha [Acidimicrobiales bacterium]|nr:proteasome subunit alpha [Acidimicrobiales bacterium]